jgi:uncharacterized protein YecA (UPF0149 family)
MNFARGSFRQVELLVRQRATQKKGLLMDTTNGRIYQMDEEFEKLRKADPPRFMEMMTPPTEKQMQRTPPKVKGYEKCPCGSGKQFKNCCKTSGASA